MSIVRKTQHVARACLLGSLIAAFSVASASSLDTLSSWNGSDYALFWVPMGYGSDHYVQSFKTPNASDVVLTNVECRIAVEQTVPWNANYAPTQILGEVRIYELSGSQVVSGALATSSTVTVTDTTGAWNPISVALGVTLDSTKTYGLDFVNLSGGVGRLAFRWSNPYTGGRALFADEVMFPNLATLGSVDGDLALRADFSPVPEPGSIAVMMLGLLVFRRRR